ncbi:hypothetical protein DXG03_002894 [Asterophora parasitica]|uniref:Uncharacterized protein n=1 Tax=Asterophora parasitica TaxID=117018 RepID=A0A9P7KF83_9AGAR|nr:hypothetical protein DXG03_002894 [Asterophora parasitica]
MVLLITGRTFAWKLLLKAKLSELDRMVEYAGSIDDNEKELVEKLRAIHDMIMVGVRYKLDGESGGVSYDDFDDMGIEDAQRTKVPEGTPEWAPARVAIDMCSTRR